MGVDYYQCDKCTYGFRDDSERAVYCSCGAKFCSTKCAKETYADPDNTDFEDDDGDPNEPLNCCICRGEHCNDYILLRFLLDYFNLSYDEAKELYLQENKK